MMGAREGGPDCHGIRVEVSFLLIALSLRTLFGVVASCEGGVEVENLTFEGGVIVNQVGEDFGITQGQGCNQHFNSVQCASYERLLAIVRCL
jgi:hypothetical protein